MKYKNKRPPSIKQADDSEGRDHLGELMGRKRKSVSGEIQGPKPLNKVRDHLWVQTRWGIGREGPGDTASVRSTGGGLKRLEKSLIRDIVFI